MKKTILILMLLFSASLFAQRKDSSIAPPVIILAALYDNRADSSFVVSMIKQLGFENISYPRGRMRLTGTKDFITLYHPAKAKHDTAFFDILECRTTDKATYESWDMDLHSDDFIWFKSSPGIKPKSHAYVSMVLKLVIELSEDDSGYSIAIFSL